MATRKVYYDSGGSELQIYINDNDKLSFELEGSANTPDGIATVIVELDNDDVKEMITELQKFLE